MELLFALPRIAHSELGEAPREQVDVLVRGIDEEPRQLRHVVVAELPGRAEVDQSDRPGLLEHQDVRGVRVGVEHPVTKDHRHPRLGHQVGEVAPLLHRQRERVHVRQLRSLEPFEREHARACV